MYCFSLYFCGQILAVWAAQAGAKKVYAIEYTAMASHAKKVMTSNGVDHIVTVIQSSVEEVELPIVEDQLDVETNDKDCGESFKCIDIIVSEWMGYFLLRESMLDSIVRARDKFLKSTGLMFPSHCTMLVAPVVDEEERKVSANEYASSMSDWHNFEQTTSQMYGVNMNVLEKDFDREQKEYYLLSSRWTELQPDAILAEPAVIKRLDMSTCTIEEARGIENAAFDFDIRGDEYGGPISGIAGWFTSDFCSRTDENASLAPKLHHPAFLSTGPEAGYTHWGQQVFHFLNSIPILQGETVRLSGHLDMMRTKENTRLYNCRINYQSSRRKSQEDRDSGNILMKSMKIDQVYQIP